MGRIKERYDRRAAERRFAGVYEAIDGDLCIYCGMPSDGRQDHQPPVYVLHLFADGKLVTRRQICEAFGQCRLVPCCTICNMGLGAFHGTDNERRGEILNWFLADARYPEDELVLRLGERLLAGRFERGQGPADIYAFPGVGRIIYIEALAGFIDGSHCTPAEFPEWLVLAQRELAEWLRLAPRRKPQYFLAMANLESYDLLPHARDDPRGQIGAGELPVRG
jgi:hypothetical protein